MAPKEEPVADPVSKSHPDGLAIIHVALFRMATRSLAEAYRILGYKTHHGIDDILGNPWELIEQAAEATWPSVPDARPRERFTRADWDALWGHRYDIATDMACPFADQLVAAYPHAKVVVVQRDFDSWWASYQAGVLDKLFSPAQQFWVFLVSRVLGSRAAHAMFKLNYGLFGAASLAEIEAHARTTYDAYYSSIRAAVPPERRLEYTMGDGWEPLCAFLGKEVPDVPFPRLNDGKYRREQQSRGESMVFASSVGKMARWVVGPAAIAAAAWYVWAR
ncbi:hypothetical protein ACO1O0_004652 [Amphichorda felina]